ncbi:MAG TPA: histidine phosphatase family protein [Streptosporangiaceae bacterium]|jgi:phosphohistidine phosphatase
MSAGPGRKLVLLRHAKSAWPDVPDHERPLARRGRRNAPAMGRWMRAAGHLPDLVLCSTVRRAPETWQLVQPGLGVSPPVYFDADIYETSAPRLLELIRRAPPAARTILAVGHDPAVPELAVTLAATHGGSVSIAPPAMFDRMRTKFPTAAIAVLEFTGTWNRLAPGSARLTCFVTPRELLAPEGAHR